MRCQKCDKELDATEFDWNRLGDREQFWCQNCRKYAIAEQYWGLKPYGT